MLVMQVYSGLNWDGFETERYVEYSMNIDDDLTCI